jgi:hypothetical protein
MKTNIIVSNSNSRFLQVLRTIRHPSIDFYFIDLSEIFKAYDILKPKYIVLNNYEIDDNTVSLFRKEPKVSEKLFINNDNKTYNIINKNLFSNIDFTKNKSKNLAIFNMSNKEDDIIKNLQNNNISFCLFNSSLKHKYNLGAIEYSQIPKLLQEYRGVVSHGNIYSSEAFLSKCLYYRIEDDDLINNLLTNNYTPVQEPEDVYFFIEKKFHEK